MKDRGGRERKKKRLNDSGQQREIHMGKEQCKQRNGKEKKKDKGVKERGNEREGGKRGGKIKRERKQVNARKRDTERKD